MRLRDIFRRQKTQADQLRFGRDSRPPANPQGELKSGMGGGVNDALARAVRTQFGAGAPPAPPGLGPMPAGAAPQMPPPVPPPAPAAPNLQAPNIAAPPPKTEPLVSRALTPEPPIEQAELPAEDQYGPQMPSEEEMAMLDMNRQAELEASARTAMQSSGLDQDRDSVAIAPGYKARTGTDDQGNPKVSLDAPDDLEGWKTIPDDYEQFLAERAGKQAPPSDGEGAPDGPGITKMSPQIQLEMVKLLRKAGEAAPWEIPSANAAPVQPWRQ